MTEISAVCLMTANMDPGLLVIGLSRLFVAALMRVVMEGTDPRNKSGDGHDDEVAAEAPFL